MTTRRQWRLLFLDFTLALSVAACTGGQSGHEGVGDETPSCPSGRCGGKPAPKPSACACNEFVGRAALHAIVTLLSGDHVEVQVRGPAAADACTTNGDPALPRAGRIVGGQWQGLLPCTPECAGIKAGDEVLALYEHNAEDEQRCPQYLDCLDAECAAEGSGRTGTSSAECDMSCEEKTRSDCADYVDETWLDGRVALTLWNDELQLGGNWVSQSDAAALTVGGADCDQALHETAIGELSTGDSACLGEDASYEPPAVDVCTRTGR
jgi:hypothetical protein